MKKKKIVALITLHHVKNYGSVLQTLATQKLFEKLGYKVIVIDYRRAWETNLGYWFFIADKSVKGYIRQMVYFPTKVIQHFVFGKFLKKYIHLTRNVYTCMEDFERYPLKADIFCTGSDQVWNSGWNQGVIPAYYLSFVKDNSVKIAYAASIGKNELSEEEKVQFRGLLNSYKYITVREENAVNILKDVYNGPLDNVLDPTLQIKKEDWEELISIKKIQTDYVLLIQLNRNHLFDDFAVEFAKQKGKKLIRLCLRVDQCVLPGKHILIPEVQNYIRLIRDADYVLTDSFHAISFCLNFQKQFYCVLPEKYSGRLKNVIYKFGLEDRIVEGYLLNEMQNVEIDYDKVNHVLEKERIRCQYIIENIVE